MSRRNNDRHCTPAGPLRGQSAGEVRDAATADGNPSTSSGHVRRDRWTELLQQAQRGAPVALEELSRELLPWLFVIARQFLGNEADAWDAVQDTFVRLCQNLARFRSRVSCARTWIARIARNVAIDHSRRRTRRRTEPLGGHEFGWARDDPVVAAELRESCEVVRGALNALEPRVRTAIVLRYDSGLSFEALGQALHIPLGTAATHVYRGIKALRNSFGSVA
jgi:RNA polymerase sigma-70 factor (ECF subfamily)